MEDASAPATPREATRLMVETLARAIRVHEQGTAQEIGLDYDDVLKALLPIPPEAEFAAELALRFYDSWGDAARHDWKYYPGIADEDWPRLARRLIAFLESGERVDDPLLVRKFGPRPSLFRRVVGWFQRGKGGSLLGVVAILSVSAASANEWPPEGAASAMGLVSRTDGSLEVRVWLGGGMSRPYDLFRVVETGGTVIVRHVVWIDIGEKPARDRRFLEKHYCPSSASSSGRYLWCETPLESDGPWDVLLRDLLPDRLWTLPEEPPRECGGSVEDGESVGIEILRGDQRHAVSYGSPEFCCPHEACAIVDHARTVVREGVR